MSYNPYLPEKHEKELRKLYAREQKDANPLSQDDLKRYKDMVAQYEKDKVDAYWKDTIAKNMKLIEYDGHTIATPGNKIPIYEHPELVYPTERYERNYRYAVENEHAERQLAVCAMSQMFCKDEQQLNAFIEIDKRVLIDNKDALYDISNKPREMRTLRERDLLDAAEERVPELTLEIKKEQKQELEQKKDEISEVLAKEQFGEELNPHEQYMKEMASTLLEEKDKQEIKQMAMKKMEEKQKQLELDEKQKDIDIFRKQEDTRTDMYRDGQASYEQAAEVLIQLSAKTKGDAFEKTAKQYDERNDSMDQSEEELIKIGDPSAWEEIEEQRREKEQNEKELEELEISEMHDDWYLESSRADYAAEHGSIHNVQEEYLSNQDVMNINPAFITEDYDVAEMLERKMKGY